MSEKHCEVRLDIAPNILDETLRATKDIPNKENKLEAFGRLVVMEAQQQAAETGYRLDRSKPMRIKMLVGLK